MLIHRPQSTSDYAFAHLLLAAAIVFFMLATGCDRHESPQIGKDSASGGDASLDRAGGQTVEAELKYALVKTFESGLKQLSGIAIDTEDRIYLVGAEGIGVLDLEGKQLGKWRTSGPARCVAADVDGNVYVGLRTKVEKYDKDGKLLASWGAKGKRRGELGLVTAISVSGVNVFVADAGNRCVHRFDTTGDFIDEIGKRDSESGFLGLICPSPYLDCVVGAGGLLYVTNPGKQRVEKYQIDGELLNYWGTPGTRPERFCGCCNPINIALMANGQIVTAEKDIPRVKVYDSKGKMLAFIGPKFFSKEVAGLDLAVDSMGRIYVIDPEDGKVRVFERKE